MNGDPAALRFLRDTLSGIRSYVAAVERLEHSEVAIPLKDCLREHVDAGRALRPAAHPERSIVPLFGGPIDPWPEVVAARAVGPRRRVERCLLRALLAAETACLGRFVRTLHDGELRPDVRATVVDLLLPRHRQRIERLRRMLSAAAAGGGS